jgi:SAM-dependent methyltransferase
MSTLFDEVIECPQCRGVDFKAAPDGQICARCGYLAKVDGRFIALLPQDLSDNNAREAEAYKIDDGGVINYMINKPYNYPRLVQEAYLRCTAIMRDMAAELGEDPSVLFLFGGGGMEAHLSGLLGEKVVIADISTPLLRMAATRFSHYGVPEPAAYITCDAERLPFRNKSFDLVVGFEGVHHCLVPQAALSEIWRVARKRAFIVDNYESSLTRLMYRFGQSSQVEHSGVKPNRFTMNMLETMLYNARIKKYSFAARTSLPQSITDRMGYWPSKGLTRLIDLLNQQNMFILVTHHDS